MKGFMTMQYNSPYKYKILSGTCRPTVTGTFLWWLKSEMQRVNLFYVCSAFCLGHWTLTQWTLWNSCLCMHFATVSHHTLAWPRPTHRNSNAIRCWVLCVQPGWRSGIFPCLQPLGLQFEGGLGFQSLSDCMDFSWVFLPLLKLKPLSFSLYGVLGLCSD